VQQIEELIFYGAEINQQNAGGNTALHVCAANSQVSALSRASASEMTYIVSGGALNSTHSLTDNANEDARTPGLPLSWNFWKCGNVG